MHKTKSRSAFSFYGGNLLRSWRLSFEEVEGRNTCSIWLNEKMSLILLQWLWVSAGLCVRANAECFVRLMLWVKGDCKTHKRWFQVLRKTYRDREKEWKKKEVYNGQEEWMSKWALWIILGKNKGGGSDRKIGNYKLNTKYIKYIKMREKSSYTPGNK